MVSMRMTVRMIMLMSMLMLVSMLVCMLVCMAMAMVILWGTGVSLLLISALLVCSQNYSKSKSKPTKIETRHPSIDSDISSIIIVVVVIISSVIIIIQCSCRSPSA